MSEYFTPPIVLQQMRVILWLEVWLPLYFSFVAKRLFAKIEVVKKRALNRDSSTGLW